jgi:ABC-type oligopeptide transport system substrate-binding subunit
VAANGKAEGRNAMSAANGWRGNNRSAWSHPEVDRLIERFTAALEERERLHAEREIVRILSAELPLLPMWIAIEPTFVPTGFSGWLGYKKGLLPDGSKTWNVETWERTL